MIIMGQLDYNPDYAHLDAMNLPNANIVDVMWTTWSKRWHSHLDEPIQVVVN